MKTTVWAWPNQCGRTARQPRAVSEVRLGHGKSRQSRLEKRYGRHNANET